jgi:hypothetical protein
MGMFVSAEMSFGLLRNRAIAERRAFRAAGDNPNMLHQEIFRNLLFRDFVT